MSQIGKILPNLDQNGTKLLNLTVLQRIDPTIEEILMTAAHVAFYEFNIELNQWSRKDVEGSLFVVKRNAQPMFQFIVMNRRNTDNLIENLSWDFEFELQVPYLLYRNAAQEVNGIWFYNSRECEDAANLINRETLDQRRSGLGSKRGQMVFPYLMKCLLLLCHLLNPLRKQSSMKSRRETRTSMRTRWQLQQLQQQRRLLLLPRQLLRWFVSHYSGKSKEEIAAIRIQTAFRGHLARRALRALRGLVRLKSLIEGQSVKRQVTNTLKCMQTLARLQSQIRTRRIRMSEENQALQKQLQQKHEMELEQQRMGEEWVDSTQTKEQIEAGLQSKQEAAMRRERALAYAYSHQMRKNTKSSNPTFMDPNNPHWGWSWLERWMASRPWEARITTDREWNDHASVKSAASRSLSVTPSRVHNRVRPMSPRRWSPAPDDVSIQSERHRRHSIAGSLVRDDESLASSPAVPSYMASTKSAKARTTKPASPLGSVEKNGYGGTPPDKVSSMASAKKRLSFPASPSGPRRHSLPGKMESNGDSR